MKFVTLPAKLQDESDNIVKITNKKLDPASEKGTIFEIPADRFEYPQVESLDEAVQIAGSSDRLLEVINDHLRDDSVGEGKNSIRMATTGTIDDIILAGLSKTKNFTWVETAKVSAAEAKEKFGNLAALVKEKNLSNDELAEAVRKMLGL
jgi:hypothetical protein